MTGGWTKVQTELEKDGRTYSFFSQYAFSFFAALLVFETSLKLKNLPGSVSKVLGLQMGATMLSLIFQDIYMGFTGQKVPNPES